MSPLAERRWHRLADDVPVRDTESAVEMTGKSSDAAIARRPGTTRIHRDIQEPRRPRQVMSLSIAVLKREGNSKPVRRKPRSTSSRESVTVRPRTNDDLPVVVVLVLQLLRDERGQIGFVEGEHEPRVRIVEAAEHRVVIVVVGHEQRVLDPATDDDVLAEREPFDLGGNLV